jgi:uncharacterized membrane protein YsdA (DUF1294 family)
MLPLVLIGLLAGALYIAMSLVSFIAFGADKFRAQAGAHRRTPEATLHLLSFLGGFPGSLLAMRVFRHKTSKPEFKAMTMLAVLTHIALWIAIGVIAWRAYA